MIQFWLILSAVAVFAFVMGAGVGYRCADREWVERLERMIQVLASQNRVNEDILTILERQNDVNNTILKVLKSKQGETVNGSQ